MMPCNESCYWLNCFENGCAMMPGPSKSDDTLERYKLALQKIARAYPCETAEDMKRLAKETLGEMHYNID